MTNDGRTDPWANGRRFMGAIVGGETQIGVREVDPGRYWGDPEAHMTDGGCINPDGIAILELADLSTHGVSPVDSAT